MSAQMRRLKEAQVALMTLSRLPAGRISGEAPSPADACWAFPLAGILVGLIGGLFYIAGALMGLPPAAGALLALAAGAIVTGAMHEDGLADIADGFGGGKDRPAKLDIMRDSRIGSFGVMALILTVAAKTACIAGFVASPYALALFVAIAAGSRAAMACVMAVMAPARGDGLGHSAARPESWRVLAALAIALLAFLPLGLPMIGIAAAMAVSTLALIVVATHQIGGQTGDVLGAAQQLAETAGWLAAASVMSF